MRQYLGCFYHTLFFLLLTTIGSFAQLQSSPGWYSGYDVKWYKLDIHANDTVAYVWGSTTILSETKASFADTFHFELAKNVTIDSVKIFGSVHSYSRKGDVVTVPLNRHVNSGYLLQVEVYHRGGNAGSEFFSSFTNKRDSEWKIPVTWTLSEPFGAKSWFPCKQSLADKADSASVIITVPKNTKAGSNGRLEAVIAVDSFTNKYTWTTKYPVAYYLLSFTVANYNDYSFYAPVSSTDSVLVQNFYYNRPGFFEKNKKDMDATSQFIRLFSDLFGEYPFKKEKYGHCVAPMGGGMEHQTMTTLSGFGYDLVSHELAHQWFGDLVTCTSWQDIWVNEGFASYSEYLALEFLKSKQESQDWLKHALEYTFYYPDGSVFIPKEDADNENRIFNFCLSYKKGAAIIHTLRNEIQNDAVFFSILKEFLSLHAFKNASASDFIEMVDQKTGKDYHWFFNQWYYGKGYPEVELFWQQKGDTLKINAIQTNSANGAQPFKMHYGIQVANSGKDTVIRVLQDTWNQFFTLSEKNKVESLKVNPEYTCLMKVAGTHQVVDLPTADNAFSIRDPKFSEGLQVQLNRKTDKNARIFICDLKGNLILESRVKNKKMVLLDTKSMEAGYYLLNFTAGNEKFVRVINKMK